MSLKKIDISDKTKKLVGNVDDNNDKDHNNYFPESKYESNEIDPDQDDDDSNIKEVAPLTHIKKPTATKPSFKKFPERIPEEYTIHNYVCCNYTENEIVLICAVANIESPRKLLEYKQDCLAQELEYWWNLQAKNPFSRNHKYISTLIFVKALFTIGISRQGNFINDIIF